MTRHPPFHRLKIPSLLPSWRISEASQPWAFYMILPGSAPASLLSTCGAADAQSSSRQAGETQIQTNPVMTSPTKLSSLVFLCSYTRLPPSDLLDTLCRSPSSACSITNCTGLLLSRGPELEIDLRSIPETSSYGIDNFKDCPTGVL